MGISLSKWHEPQRGKPTSPKWHTQGGENWAEQAPIADKEQRLSSPIADRNSGAVIAHYNFIQSCGLSWGKRESSPTEGKKGLSWAFSLLRGTNYHGKNESPTEGKNGGFYSTPSSWWRSSLRPTEPQRWAEIGKLYYPKIALSG